MFIVTLVFLGCGVTILIAATREPGDSLACIGLCGAGDEAIAAEASIISPNRSRAAAVGAESARALAAGTTLFQERGCIGCHRPDASGVGPALQGLFGRPVQDPGFMRAAQTLRSQGSFAELARLVPYAEINGLFATDLPGHQAQGR